MTVDQVRKEKPLVLEVTIALIRNFVVNGKHYFLTHTHSTKTARVCLLKDQFVFVASSQDDIPRFNFEVKCKVVFKENAIALLLYPR